MLTGINYVVKEDTFIEFEKNGEKSSIRFSDIVPFWSYATEEDFEGGIIKIIGDKILFTMLTASSQGGIVAVWNTDTEEVEHGFRRQLLCNCGYR